MVKSITVEIEGHGELVLTMEQATRLYNDLRHIVVSPDPVHLPNLMIPGLDDRIFTDEPVMAPGLRPWFEAPRDPAWTGTPPPYHFTGTCEIAATKETK